MSCPVREGAIWFNGKNLLTDAEARNRIAVLIPMLRVRSEQIPQTYNGHTDFEKVTKMHMHEDGKFSVSEPQLALHSKLAAARNFTFNENKTYGAGNKASLMYQLCPYAGKGEIPVQHAHCCELVQMKLRQQSAWNTNYYGGELALKIYTQRVNKEKDGVALSDNETKRLTLESTEKLFRNCGATVRLFNYPPADGPTQLKLATGVFIRAKTREQGSKNLGKYLRTYLKFVDGMVW